MNMFFNIYTNKTMDIHFMQILIIDKNEFLSKNIFIEFLYIRIVSYVYYAILFLFIFL